jgi:hypothetical protein
MANYIYFKYNAQTKPILTDRNGEAIVNWVDGGTHSVTADATHVYSGTKSFKLHATDGGSFSTNFISLASGNNSTFTVDHTYVIAIHIYVEVARSIVIQTGGVNSSALTGTAGSWITVFFAFTAATATTALKIMCTEAADVWFELEPIYEGNQFPVLIEKGLVKPERFSLYPQIINEYIDGSKDTQFKAFIRSLNLQTNTLTDSQALTYLYWTFTDNLGTVDYDIDGKQETGLHLIPDAEQELQWRFDLKLARYLEVNFSEGVARTVFP